MSSANGSVGESNNDKTRRINTIVDGPRAIGRYRIEEVLGEGAMGIVFKGFDPSIQRYVAIKTIHAGLLTAEGADEFLARFRREAQSAGRFVHANVVTVFEFGEHEGMPYLALEYVAGRELKAVLSEGPLPLSRVRHIFSQILAGLQAAHEHGVVHRDIKPQNIFVLPDGLTKVGDFGIARLDDTGLTRTGSSFGTPSYMSPEQFTGEPADRRSDLYSAAAVLYEMLAGAKPFRGSTVTEVMYAVLEKAPPDLSDLARNVPPAVIEVVTKGLAKSPDMRFQSAKEFALALDTAFHGRKKKATRGRAGKFKSTDRLTLQTLPTLNIELPDYSDDIMPLIARRVCGNIGSAASDLIQNAARRNLRYDDLIGLARGLRIDSLMRGEVLILAEELAGGAITDRQQAELDAQLTALARSQ